ncbi:MAG: alpha/beta fold hydrolase, partial [Acidimicrobiales bacterium]
MLATTKRGKGSRVVLIHGFSQSADSWLPLTSRLSAVHQVVAVDAPGHGASAAVRADLAAGADLIAAAGGRAAYVGYSMGGRFALHVALRHPDVVERLVLVSATAGIDDPSERAARAAGDERIARRIERDGVAAFLDWWLERPLFATVPRHAAGL